jgi:hypothetical protein
MGDEEKGMVKKILWTENVKNIEKANSALRGLISKCKELENEGFGILEDVNNPGKIDSKENDCSIVCPDGGVFTSEQIAQYFYSQKNKSFFYYRSGNLENNKMFKAQWYYNGFKEALALSLEI